MYMTDSEITEIYRSAKNKERQVTVLADLNACRKYDMAKKLAELGLRELKEKPPATRPLKEPNWTKIDYDAAKALYDEGRTDEEISAQLGCSLYAFRNWRSAHKLPQNRPRRFAFDEALAMELYRDGKTDAAIAAATGLSKSGVYSWRKRNGLPSAVDMRKHVEKPVPAEVKPKPQKPPRLPCWARIDYDKAKALYDEKMTDEDMAKILDCSVHAVQSWRKAFHLPSVKTMLIHQQREEKRKAQQQARDAKRDLRHLAAQAGKLVLRGKLGALPLKITIEIGV